MIEKADLIMKNMRQSEKYRGLSGFTLIEIIIVALILAVSAMLVIPMVTNAADMQIRSAANRIAADLDYAKSLAITHQSRYSVVFDSANESYEIQDEHGDPIKNPVRPSDDFVVNFSTDSRLSQVDIDTVDFDSESDETITFDYLGSPYSATTTPLSSGQIILQDKQTGNFTLTVDVEPITGYVTMSGF